MHVVLSVVLSLFSMEVVMVFTLKLSLGIALALAVVGCGRTSKSNKAPHNPNPAEVAAQAGPGGFRTDFRSSDHFFTKMRDLRQGTSPHGRSQIYYSTNIKSLIETSSFIAPIGTVAIKPFDMVGDSQIDGIAVMVKKEAGYDPEHSDWYYENRMPDGALAQDPAPGKIAMCISCHANATATDYLLGTHQ
jgi:hypothetical protein